MTVSVPWPEATAHPTPAEPIPPITTPWDNPDECTFTYDISHTSAELVAWLDLMPNSTDATVSCYPPGMFDGPSEVWGQFSPASCPRGWTTVSVNADTGNPVDATTTATCCSAHFDYYDDGYCGRSMPYVLAVPISYYETNNSTTYTIMTESTTTLAAATIAVHTILAMWQENDQSAVGLTDQDDIEVDQPVPDGLSTEAKVGLGIGAVVTALLISALIFILLRRRRMSSTRRSRSRSRSRSHSRSHSHSRGHHDLSVAQQCRCLGGHASPDIGADTPVRHWRPDTAGADPPPAYDTSADARGGVLGHGNCSDGGDDGNNSESSREVEILALREQKAAIQRRILELEGTAR